MAFVHQPLGALVATNPAEAHAQLAVLFAEHKTREAVSKAIAVDARTLARWIAKLAGDGGPGDPRKKIEGKPAKKGRRRKAKKKVVAR
jgi:hypothetical protein